jgi:hypothetical protein
MSLTRKYQWSIDGELQVVQVNLLLRFSGVCTPPKQV